MKINGKEYTGPVFKEGDKVIFRMGDHWIEGTILRWYVEGKSWGCTVIYGKNNSPWCPFSPDDIHPSTKLHKALN